MAKKSEPIKAERAQQKTVNAGSVFWGLLLIALGVLFLLENLDIVQLHLENVWQLWPLLIVGVGVSLLNLKGALGVVVNVLLIAAALGLAIIGVTNESGLRLTAQEATVRGDGHSSALVEQEDDSVKRLAVDIKTGALELLLGSNPEADKLVEAELHGSKDFTLDTRTEVSGETQQTYLTTSGKSVNVATVNERNSLHVDVARNLPTSLKIDAGASSVKGDLSELRLNELTLDTGASSVDLKLGDKENELNVAIDTGVSSITLRIPKLTGVRVEYDGGLSSTNFAGLDKKENGLYESTGYESAEKKITISSDIGVSSFKIVRY